LSKNYVVLTIQLLTIRNSRTFGQPQSLVMYHVDSSILPRNVRTSSNLQTTLPSNPLVQDALVGFIVVSKFGFRRSFSERKLGSAGSATLASFAAERGLFTQINAANEQLGASATKSDLLHIISHDLKSPLTVISGYAEILMDGPERVAENWESILQEILSQTRMMTRLIEDTLAISKIESGVIELNLEDVDVFHPIENLVAIHQHECTFKKDVPRNLPKVRADKLRLHEILDNLITAIVPMQTMRSPYPRA
jgi:signal transduction histidine kinase